MVGTKITKRSGIVECAALSAEVDATGAPRGAEAMAHARGGAVRPNQDATGLPRGEAYDQPKCGECISRRERKIATKRFERLRAAKENDHERFFLDGWHSSNRISPFARRKSLGLTTLSSRRCRPTARNPRQRRKYAEGGRASCASTKRLPIRDRSPTLNRRARHHGYHTAVSTGRTARPN